MRYLFIIFLCLTGTGLSFHGTFIKEGSALFKTRRFSRSPSLKRHAYMDENSLKTGENGTEKGQIEGVAPALISLRSAKAKRSASKNRNTKRKANNKKEGEKKASFKRTNRVNGMKVWVRELQILQDQLDTSKLDTDKTNGIGLVVELAKELLYSGIPEQVLELYAAYYDSIVARQGVDVVIDVKLVLVTIRAFLSLQDVEGALRLLSLCRRAGLNFDTDSYSIIIKEMADTSADGLNAALRLWDELKVSTPMTDAENNGKKVLSVTGYCGLLSGIIKHGITRRQSGSALLVDSLDEDALLEEEHGSLWYMPISTAETIATQLVDEYLDSALDKGKNGNKKINYKVLYSFLRFSFRLGATKAKLKLNSNFEIDSLADQQERAKEGLRQALLTMQNRGITWTLPVADVLIEECLRLGDVASVEFVVEQMRLNNIVSRTSTFNALLKQYSETYDGESAFYLLQEMAKDPQTKPNVESYRSVLKACSRSDRGKYFSEAIVENLLAEDHMFKEAWDRCLEHQIAHDYSDYFALESLLSEMVESGTQPDDDTMIVLYDAYNRAQDLQSAVRLYQKQATSEIQRRWFRQTLQASSNVTVVDLNYQGRKIAPLLEEKEGTGAEGTVGEESPSAGLDGGGSGGGSNVYAFLPPPSLTSTCHLLELLRDTGDYVTAGSIVTDMMERNVLTRKNVPVTTQSGKTGVSVTSLSIGYSNTGHELLSKQYAPDGHAFVLAMEACLNLDAVADADEDTRVRELSKRAEVAIDMFNKMEQSGIVPDRRTYAALIKVFGLLQSDVASALGVFDELRSKFVPDVENLQSVLEVCKRNPLDLRTMCIVLEEMVEEEGSPVDLDVFSKDILMQMFPDALTLGRVLESMERQAVPKGTEVVYAGISVLSVLAQALRTKNGIEPIMQVMLFLGSCGIRPDQETMEYFRPVQAPEKNSFGSKDHFKLQPHKLKQRSLMDITTPLDMHGDLELPSRGFQRSSRAVNADRVPYFESQNRAWSQHEAALKKAIKSDWESYDNVDDEGSEGDDEEESEDIIESDAEIVQSPAERELPTIGSGEGEAVLPSLSALGQEDPIPIERGRREYTSSSRRNKKEIQNDERGSMVTKSDRRSSRKKSS